LAAVVERQLGLLEPAVVLAVVDIVLVVEPPELERRVKVTLEFKGTQAVGQTGVAVVVQVLQEQDQV
jgi:competence protein ComGC